MGIIQPVLLFLLVDASQVPAWVWLAGQCKRILKHSFRPKVLIYGTKSTGHQLVAALANSYEIQVGGFLVNDNCLRGHVLNGQLIYNPEELANRASAWTISDVLPLCPVSVQAP